MPTANVHRESHKQGVRFAAAALTFDEALEDRTKKEMELRALRRP
jgi:hypothetical protein